MPKSIVNLFAVIGIVTVFTTLGLFYKYVTNVANQEPAKETPIFEDWDDLYNSRDAEVVKGFLSTTLETGKTGLQEVGELVLDICKNRKNGFFEEYPKMREVWRNSLNLTFSFYYTEWLRKNNLPVTSHPDITVLIDSMTNSACPER
jgi:hypothetical protein